MRGEKMPKINLDDFAEIEQLGVSSPALSENCPARPQVIKEISCRYLLRCNFLEGS
jgi:hypothetical protein